MEASKLIRSCGLVVFIREEETARFLLLKSSRDGYWGLPKGHVIHGEAPLDAALRELKEETGSDDVSLTDGFQVAITYKVRKQGVLKPKQVDYFLGEKRDLRVSLSEEHSEYRWATLREAEELLDFENLKDVLRKAHKMIFTFLR